ncbi:MAG: ATP-binding protein [Pseudomonadota bacterium]|nr:ATP-binding protein [Pseudomonadota bacterium]
MNLLDNLRQSPATRFAPILAGAMLLPLHAGLAFDLPAPSFHILMANHLVLFAIWRLLSFSDRGFPAAAVVIILAAATLLLVVPFGAWLVGWLVLLNGTLGQVVYNREGRSWLYLPAALYSLFLLSAALFQSLTEPRLVLPVDHPAGLTALVLLAAAVCATLVPNSRSAARRANDSERVPLAGLLWSSLGMLTGFAITVSVGALANSYGSGTPLEIAPVAALPALLLCLLFILARSAGNVPKRGRSTDDSTQMLGIANALLLASRDEQSDRPFLDIAMQILLDLGYVAGLTWEGFGRQGELGTCTGQAMALVSEDLKCMIYTGHDISARQRDRAETILRLAEEFERSRIRQQDLRHQAHLETIYEAGARITHDTKNLLQSLQTLSTAVLSSTPEQAPQVQQLLQKQLPQLTQRLRATLDKLQAPQDVSTTFQVARIWWGKLTARYQSSDITFEQELLFDQLLPRDLFDRTVENLIENARRKRQTERDLAIRVKLVVTDRGVCLTACDTGSPVPEPLAKTLLSRPVESADGYGIGLYQVASQAKTHGFRLYLAHNEPGRVCFRLETVTD